MDIHYNPEQIESRQGTDRRMHCGNCVRNFIMRLKHLNPNRFRSIRTIHDASDTLRACPTINRIDVNERISMDQKPVRSLIKDGPSLRDFLVSPATDVDTNEDPVPYMRDVRGENQKGFSDPPLHIVLPFHAA